LVLKPDFSGGVDVEAGNKYFHSYVFYDLNTLNQRHFCYIGMEILCAAWRNLSSAPRQFVYQVGSESGIIDTLSFQNYGQLRINVERYKPIGNKYTLITQINSGMNLKQNQSFLIF